MKKIIAVTLHVCNSGFSITCNTLLQNPNYDDSQQKYNGLYVYTEDIHVEAKIVPAALHEHN